MSKITINDLTFDAKSGEQLDNVSLELASPHLVGLCSNEKGAVTALTELLLGKGKVLNGKVTVNDVPFKQLRRQSKDLIGQLEDVVLKGKTVEKAVAHALKHHDHALELKQALAMIAALKFKPDQLLAELSAEEQNELKILVLLAWQYPIVLLGDGLDKLTREQGQTLCSLIKDYAQKVGALVLFASDEVATLMQFADTICYFNGTHLTSIRDLSMNNGVDCTVTVRGTGFPIDNAVKLGAHMLAEAEGETRFLFTGNIQTLLPLLEQSTITDVRIADATIEDELMVY